MNKTPFDRFGKKLEQNVYSSLKGRIRLEMLQADFEEFCPEFTSRRLKILDIGGGAGHFAATCLFHGHEVLLCDASEQMLAQAGEQLQKHVDSGRLTLLHHDFLLDHPLLRQRFDAVLMHGSAEWMSDTTAAIRKASSLCLPECWFSLLIFNKDKHMLKQGVNGHLLQQPVSRKKKLIPPGAMAVADVRRLLLSMNGDIVLQSGIRIFHNFFRQIDESVLTPEQWLEQEKRHYRTPPFSLLGEHSHFLCRFSS